MFLKFPSVLEIKPVRYYLKLKFSYTYILLFWAGKYQFFVPAP